MTDVAANLQSETRRIKLAEKFFVSVLTVVYVDSENFRESN